MAEVQSESIGNLRRTSRPIESLVTFLHKSKIPKGVRVPSRLPKQSRMRKIENREAIFIHETKNLVLRAFHDLREKNLHFPGHLRALNEKINFKGFS